MVEIEMIIDDGEIMREITMDDLLEVIQDQEYEIHELRNEIESLRRRLGDI